MGNNGILTFDVEKHPYPVSTAERDVLLQNPGFGRIFTDHMVTIRYSAAKGWHHWKIEPRKALDLDPATIALHYAPEIFEGLKAYRLPDGVEEDDLCATLPLPFGLGGKACCVVAATFGRASPAGRRACEILRNPKRDGRSATFEIRCDRRGDDAEQIFGGRLCLQSDLGTDHERSEIKRSSLRGRYPVAVDPNQPATGLHEELFRQRRHREAVSGIAETACIRVRAEQRRPAVERRWVEELGGMNIFFVFDDGSLQTPPPTGTILPGITRDSLITLARGMGLTVREEAYAIDQWQDDARSGGVTEAFACGTAAVVTPIGKVKGRSHDFTIADGNPGLITQRLKAALTDIQFGRAPDPHSWLDRLF
ncbi:branched-chain amino acid aminotransferase [Mesorhizobium sp. YR577]|nr:branched-chain amino acid aminotransferase [Mesorhizobium sp. YR577]